MKRNLIFIATFVFILLVGLQITAVEAGNHPVTISPGSETGIATIWQSCPTFSWSSFEQAPAYRIAIFESIDPKITGYEDMIAIMNPVVTQNINGPALSWTLASEESLKTGIIYAWYVQAVDAFGNAISSWSNGRIFKIEQENRFDGIEEKLREILKSYGVNDETTANVLEDMKSETKEVVVKGAGNKNAHDLSGVQGYEGDANTFYGKDAGISITTGTNNTLVGRSAGYANTAGCYNTFIGHGAGWSTSTGNENTFIGNLAGWYNTTGSWNTFLGNYAGNANTTGTTNTFLGTAAGVLNSTGYANTFIGMFAGSSNTTGYRNTFLGNDSGISNTTGNANTFLGHEAGNANTAGTNNTFVGYEAGYTNTTGSGNLFLGFKAGYNETGSNKLYIANSDTNSPLIYGEFDNSIITVNGKLGVGTKAPTYPIEVDTTGSNSCILVKRTDGASNYINATDAYANFGSISNHPLRLVVNSAWKMRLNQDGSVSMSNGASLTTGGVWTNASSKALKENIENLSAKEAVDALNKLNPVKYNYKVDKTDKHVGFIAEDVPGLVATSDRKGLSPMDITAVLTKVVQGLRRENQEQQKVILEQQKANREQQKLNRDYKKIISDLQERVAALEKK